MAAFAREVRDGPIAGVEGEAIRDVVKIAVGGSDLGPRAGCNALAPCGESGHELLEIQFVCCVLW